MGFDNDNLRLAHEASHRRILCSVPDYQYPPIPSNQSLKEHRERCRSGKVPALVPSPIRKEPGKGHNMMAKQRMPMQTDQMTLGATRPQQRPLRRSISEVLEQSERVFGKTGSE